MLERIEKITKRFFWIPFCLAFIGYYCLDGGENGAQLGFLETIYASAALYFVNPVSDNNNTMIMIAKVLALIVTTGFILSIISTVLDSVNHWLMNWLPDSTAVYTDSEFGKRLSEKMKHGYLGRTDLSDKAEATKNHIILFEDDAHNLGFYERHKARLSEKNRRVYIALNHVDSSLMKKSLHNNVRFFCLDEIKARDYWKRYDLYQDIYRRIESNDRKPYKIAIVGWDELGKAIFKQGFLNNIYSLEQQLEYHIWGCDSLDSSYLENLNTKLQLQDSICVHKGSYRDAPEKILSMDRVIVTGEKVLPTIQDLLRLNGNYRIYYCKDDAQDYKAFFNTDRLFMFGDLDELLTEENIKKEKLYRQAKLINYDYNLRYSDGPVDTLPQNFENSLEQSWNELDGFLKGSNIARADYYWIEKKNSDNQVSDHDRWKMEHIRWCRYHYYYGWSYAAGKKDKKRKLHPDLIAFEKLPVKEQKKDGIYNSIIRREMEKNL